MGCFSIILWSIASYFALACFNSAAAFQSQPADATSPTPAAAAADVLYDGRTIAAWIKVWDANEFQMNQRAIAALAAAGAPAANELGKLIEERHVLSGSAIQTLGKMGDKARVALPALLDLAADRNVQNPDGWKWNIPLRGMLFMEVKNFGWAAKEWLPVLEREANDATEPEFSRLRAIDALGGMGAGGVPILKTLAASPENKIRNSANDALVTIAVAAGRPKTEAYEEIITANPLDPNVPDYLIKTQGRYNNGEINPITQRVKAALRAQLAKKPDAEQAFALATIIRNGLVHTDLTFAAPSNSGSGESDREDPDESYATLAAALEIGVAQAPKDSDLARRCALSLARLRLLAGNWDAMNAMLTKVGQEPMPAALRPTLPAPPLDWNKLHVDWQPADKAMTAGTCAVEFQFEKDGKPLAGAHVLVKRVPDPALDRRLGIRGDTLLYATQPLEAPPYETFAYLAGDRAMTRYAVSDATGKIRIEGLPAIPVVVEVLIPSGSFPEAGKSWDLVMEVAPGDVRPTWRGDPRSIDRQKGVGVVALKEGETMHYPKLIVRPRLSLNVTEWAPVNPDDFVLEWRAMNTTAQSFDHYELEMMLTAPQQSPKFLPSQRVIQTAKVDSRAARWEVAKQGVGNLRLRPGNIYMFEVRAVDRDGKILARLPRTRVYTPWGYRESPPPARGEEGPFSGVPVYDGMGPRATRIDNDGVRTELRDQIALFMPQAANYFEYEYVLLGQAWLDCLDGKTEEGRKQIERLAQILPEGNVVRGTARTFLKQLDAGEALPKRLDFVADE